MKDIIIMQRVLLNALLVSIVVCGRIYNGDLQVGYGNAGSMTKLSFSFMLSNPITASNYIQLALPFPLHSQLIPSYPATEGLSSPLGLLATYQLKDNAQNLQPTIFTAQLLTETIDSSNYFMRFYQSDRKTLIGIPSNQWYFVTLEIQTTAPLAFQISNSVLQIQISTVSSVLSNAVVYDDNLAFNYFELAPAPSQLITLTTTFYNYGNAGGYQLIDASYNVYLDFTLNLPTQYYTVNFILQFLISQPNTFQWGSMCQSVSKTTAPIVAQLSSNLYSCSLSNNILKVTLSPNALSQLSFRFAANITNPSVVATNVSIVVNALNQYSNIILGYGIASNVLSTNSIFVTYQEIFLGWGLRPDALLPFDARIYRGNAATPTYTPFNTLTLKFSISQSVSASVELKIIIAIPSQANAFVLQNSISNNFPSFPNKQVLCTVQYVSSTTLRRIGCTGVGALQKDATYFVTWRMFFPYDNYQSSINCTQFGLLTIYSTTKISLSDNAYFLGRGDAYLSYLKNSSNYYVIGRNLTYLNYLTTFPNINLVMISSDFQDFISTPQNIFSNNRPTTYTNKAFNDVYVITQNLAFLNYISQFSDIYVAVLLKQNTDIVNGYATIPLVATTTPKNTLSISTSNSKDWTDFVTNTNPLISSTTATSGFVPGSSLRASASQQSLIFSLSAAYADVSSVSSSNATINNKWGIMIMMNPLIAPGANVVPSENPSSSLQVTVKTSLSSTVYNNYTLITLRGTTPASLQQSFPTTKAKTSFGLYPFILNTFSSIYGNAAVLDFMIATVDGIDGPQNKMKFNGFCLINGFSLSTALNTLNYGFINYQSSTPMDGSKVPTLLRVKGNIVGNTSAINSMVVFFDKLAPFYSNLNTGEIYCTNTDNSNPCLFYGGSIVSPGSTVLTLYEKYNYHSLSRIEIPLVTPATAFNVLIPVVVSASQIVTNLYIGYISTTNGVRSLAYVQPLRTISISATATASGTFGPTVSTASVGAVVSNLVLKANSPAAVSVNSGNSLGAAFSYFSEWNYFQGTTVTGWDTYGTCYSMTYLYYYTNYAAYLLGSTFQSSYKVMVGEVCVADSLGSIGSAQLTLSTGYLPAKWGTVLPGYGAVSENTGALLYLKANYQQVGQSLTVSNVQVPAAGPNIVKSTGEWVLPLPVALDRSVLIRIIGSPTTVNLPFTFTGTCAVYYNAAILNNVNCAFTSSQTTVEYTLTILQDNILPAGTQFSIFHFGISTNSSYNTIAANVYCFSLLNNNAPSTPDLIYSATNVPFVYNGPGYIGATSLKLFDFTQWTSNSAVVSSFSFSFTLLNKGLSSSNRIRFDLGQFALQNSALTVSPVCAVYEYKSNVLSADWSAVNSTGGWSNMELQPNSNLVSLNLTYTVQCKNFISTSSSTPTGITAKVISNSSDFTGELSSSQGITLPSLNSTASLSQITFTTLYSIPSANMEMTFTITSPGVTTDSFLYLVFPNYYSSGLGSDIKCYTTQEIYCTVNNRILTVRYMGTYAASTQFTLTVVGVAVAVNYNVGTFAFIFDDDNDPTSIQTAGTFTDAGITSTTLVQNFPTLSILSLTQSSSYLRDDKVTITMNIFFPTSLFSVEDKQSIFVIFPPIYSDVLRFSSPKCTLNLQGNSLKNFVSSCTVLGLRLKMPISDFMVLGAIYVLTIDDIINPTDVTSKICFYSVEVTNLDNSMLLSKSYSPNCNYVMPVFRTNPNKVSLDYFEANSSSRMQLVHSIASLQSSTVYISPGSNLSTSLYARDVSMQPLSTLLSNPANINLKAGTNPFAISFTALTSRVSYLYFTKTGDGDYYSNLPPLTVITDKNYFTPLAFQESSFRLPLAPLATNYTLTLNLARTLYPLTLVTMTVTLSAGAGIALRVSPTTITFSSTKLQASVMLYVNDATQWTLNKQATLTITPSSVYPQGTTVTLTAVTAPTTPLTVAANAASPLPKSLTVFGQCNQDAKFIYHIFRAFASNSTVCTLTPTQIQYWLSQSSLASLRIEETIYNCNDIIAVLNVKADQSYTIPISNLFASTLYKINTYCESYVGAQSSVFPMTFSTLSNGGSISQMSFYFASALSNTQKIKFVCALALYFSISYTAVATWDGYYCSELLNTRLLQEQSAKDISDSTALSRSLNRHHSTVRLLTALPTNITVFFNINTDSTFDNSSNVIAVQSIKDTLKNKINNNVIGLPQLLSYRPAITSYSGYQYIVDLSERISIGPTYFLMRGLTLFKNGLIYVMVGDNSVWNVTPSVTNMKTGLGPGGLPSVMHRVLVYDPISPASTYLAYTNLVPGKSYTIYLMSTDANPFDTFKYAKPSQIIRSYSIVPQVPAYVNAFTLCISLLLLLIL